MASCYYCPWKLVCRLMLRCRWFLGSCYDDWLVHETLYSADNVGGGRKIYKSIAKSVRFLITTA